MLCIAPSPWPAAIFDLSQLTQNLIVQLSVRSAGICQEYNILQREQTKAAKSLLWRQHHISCFVFFPKRYIFISTPVMGMGTGKRLAVLLMGPEREGSPCGEEVTPRGAIPALAVRLSRDRGWSLVWCLSWTRESIPFCVSLCELQQPPYPGGSSEPLGDLSSHPLPPKCEFL